MEPDAALYLSIGRNLAEGRGFTYLGEPNHLAYPGWPWLIALTFKLFGTASLVPVHVLVFLLSLAALALTYRLFLLHSGRPTAVVVTLGVALTKTFYEFGFELWSDMAFTVWVMAFLAGYEGVFGRRQKMSEPQTSPRRWFDYVLMIGGMALAIVTRPTMWPLLLAAVATILYFAIRRRLNWKGVLALVAALAVLAVTVMVLDSRRSSASDFGDAYEQYLLHRTLSTPFITIRKVITENAPDLLLRATADVLFQVRLGAFNAVFGLAVLGLGVGLFRRRVLWGMWFTGLTITLLLINPIVRYFLPVVPLLVFAWWELAVFLNRVFPRWFGNIAFAGLMVLGLGVNGSKVGGIIMQQHAKPFLANYDHGRFAAVPAFADKLSHLDAPADSIFLVETPYGRVLSFLSRQKVVGAMQVSVSDLMTHPVYVIEPANDVTRERIKKAGLAEGPTLVTETPDKTVGPKVSLSLHSTVPLK